MVSVLCAYGIGIAIGVIGAVITCALLFACCNIAGLCSDEEREG